jgi:N-methylhydantoinase B
MDWRAVNEGSDGRMSSGSSDGDVVQGKGALGGQRVPCARTFLLRGEQKIRLKPHRIDPVKTGDVLVKLSPGGAGVGDPWLRPADKVALDVWNEKITAEAARLIYGVIVDPLTSKVDEAATAKLRSAPPAQRYEAVINEETLDIEIKPMGTGKQAESTR